MSCGGFSCPYAFLTVRERGKKVFKKWFGKGKEEVLVAPLTGQVVSLDEVPDPTFSEKMLGEGVAILPTEGVVVAPASGEIFQLFPTKHALGLKTDRGLEVLVHIGLETVELNGEGFVAYVAKGDQVKQGQKLLEFSLDLIKQKAKDSISPIVLTNDERVAHINAEFHKEVTSGESPIMTVSLK